MGVISFRSPQEGLEQIQKSVDLISLIREIATNPQIGNTVADLSLKLSQAQELSDNKRAAAARADEIIAQSHEFLAELEKEKQLHAEKIQKDLADLAQREMEHQSNVQEFIADKISTQKSFDKLQQDADFKLQQAKTLNENTKLVQAKLSTQATELEKKQKSYEVAIEDFNAEISKAYKELDAEHAKIDEAKANLDDQIAKFEARKKRFDAALKE